jgi:hypothetical protein
VRLAMLLVGVAFGLSITGFVVNLFQQTQIDKLDKKVKCLEQPHGASSMAGVFKTINGKRTFVVTQPAHRTGC